MQCPNPYVIQEWLMDPSSPSARTVAIPFSRCHFVHIPAIQHGFVTTALFIQVWDTHERPLLDTFITVHQATYLVRVAFTTGMFVPDAPRDARICFGLLPPQSGTVLITGPVETWHDWEVRPAKITTDHITMG